MKKTLDKKFLSLYNSSVGGRNVVRTKCFTTSCRLGYRFGQIIIRAEVANFGRSQAFRSTAGYRKGRNHIRAVSKPSREMKRLGFQKYHERKAQVARDFPAALHQYARYRTSGSRQKSLRTKMHGGLDGDRECDGQGAQPQKLSRDRRKPRTVSWCAQNRSLVSVKEALNRCVGNPARSGFFVCKIHRHGAAVSGNAK